MPVYLLNLPRNAVLSICSSLEDRSIVRLREVCKKAKHIVDSSILNFRRTTVEIFQMFREKRQFKLVLFFQLLSDFLMWKICLNPLFKRLKITEIQMENSTPHRNARVEVIFKSRMLKHFLESLKPLIHRAKTIVLEVMHINTSEMCSISRFFQGNHVHMMIDNPKNITSADLDVRLKFIRIVKPISYEFHPHLLTKHCVDFLIKMAEELKYIKIFVEHKGKLRPKLAPIVREILSRKCEQLHFDEENTPLLKDASVTLQDINELIEIFHHTEKRVYFTTYTDAQPNTYQVGSLEVRIHDDRLNSVSIRSVGLKRDF